MINCKIERYIMLLFSNKQSQVILFKKAVMRIFETRFLRLPCSS
jgi:hypothetical protein